MKPTWKGNLSVARWLEWILSHRKVVLALSLVAIIGSVVSAADIHTDNSIEAYFMKDDPSYVLYREFMEEYGNDEFVYIVYTHPNGILSPQALEGIEKLSDELYQVPFVKNVNSLPNMEYLTRDEEHQLVWVNIIQNLLQTPQEIQALEGELLTDPQLVNSYISEDGRYGAILCEMEDKPSDDPNYHRKIGKAVKQALASPEYRDFQFWPVGEPILNAEFYDLIEKDTTLVTALNYGLIFTLCLVLFWNIKGLVALLATVMLANIFVVGIMGISGFPMTAIYGMAPSLLTAIGVATTMHIVLRYRLRRRISGTDRMAITEAVREVGAPTIIAALTTAIGIASFALSPVPAVRQFGIYGSLGVVLIMVLALSVLPSILSLSWKKAARPPEMPQSHAASKEKQQTRLNALLNRLAEFNRRRYRLVLAVSLVVIGVAAFGVTRLEINSSYLEEIGPHAEIYHNYKFVDQKMGGTGNLEILVHAPSSQGVITPDFLQKLADIQEYLDSRGTPIEQTYSLLDAMNAINPILYEGSEGSPPIPTFIDGAQQSAEALRNLDLETFQKFVSDDLQTARISVRVNYTDSKTATKLKEDLSAYLDSALPQDYSYDLTGATYLLARSMAHIERTQVISILTAMILISILMIFIFRSLKIGLISMIPNIISILIMMGIMGLAGIWLDYARSMIACIGIGIAVDDTIHFVFRYKQEFLLHRNYAKALKATLESTGRAVLLSSAVLIVGFGSIMASDINDMFYFGMLSALVIFIALVADLFLTPSLILLTKPFGKEISDPRDGSST